jgi:hypothetical protein
MNAPNKLSSKTLRGEIGQKQFGNVWRTDKHQDGLQQNRKPVAGRPASKLICQQQCDVRFTSWTRQAGAAPIQRA